MIKQVTFWTVIFAFAFFGGIGSANVWMDENFDDSIAFGPAGDGSGTLDDGIDLYGANPLTAPLNITANGAITSTRAFTGANSYQIAAGQSVSAASPYQDQANGPLQYFQFAVNVDSLPVAGPIATFRWNWTMDSTAYSFYVSFVSTGSAIDVVAGEDVAGSTSAVIATIGANSWQYITVQVQKNPAAADDDRLGQTGVTQGAYFYCSNATAGFSVPFTGTSVVAADWSLSVVETSIYIDSVYWEGGMTGDSTGNDNVRDPATGAELSINDWKLY
jgi:hypothetical protein